MEKIVIGLTGPQAAGKGTIAAYLKDRYGAASFRFSSPLWSVLDYLGIAPTRDALIKLSEILRSTFGEEILAVGLAQQIKQTENTFIVVDGVRRSEDITTLSNVSAFHLIGIDAPPEIRYERALARNEKPEEATITYEQFLAVEQRSTEVTARALLPKAEIILDNSGTREQLVAQMDIFLQSLHIAPLA